MDMNFVSLLKTRMIKNDADVIDDLVDKVGDKNGDK